MTDEVRYERVGAAAVLTIDRPQRRNAVDGPTAERLLEGVRAPSRPTTARGCSSSPAPGGISFCAGADLKALDTSRRRLDAPDGPMGFTRRTPTKPTIAAIGGWCLAGGLELALWCDLRIAAEGSTLGFPERRWGVPLIDGGTQRLPRIVGMGRALDLILTGRLVGADEALAMGLRHRGRARRRAPRRARWRWPRASRPSRRRRCWPIAARPSRASACRSPTGWRWRRRPARRSSPMRSPAPPASPAERGAARARRRGV